MPRETLPRGLRRGNIASVLGLLPPLTKPIEKGASARNVSKGVSITVRPTKRDQVIPNTVIDHLASIPGPIDVMPENDDIIITILIQTHKGAAPIAYFYNYTKTNYIDRSIIEDIKGGIFTKTSGNIDVRTLIAAGVCKCQPRSAVGAAIPAKETAVADQYIMGGITRANILLYVQTYNSPATAAASHTGTLTSFGFLYARHESHSEEEYGVFIDIICAMRGMKELLNFFINFAKKHLGSQFVDLHSLAHVIPYYAKQEGFQFRKTCKTDPDVSTESIIADYVDRLFPGCPYEVFSNSANGKKHDAVYTAIRDAEKLGKNYVIASDAACKALPDEPRSEYQRCMSDGIHMTKCLPTEAAGGAGAGAAASSTRRTQRRANRKRRITRRR